MASKEKKQPNQQENTAKAELIRRFKANPFLFIGTVVILFIVIIAFVLVPAFVPDIAGSGLNLYFGSYDKIPITFVPGNYFSQVREQIALRREQITDINTPTEVQYIWSQAFNQTVAHIGILREMKAAGYTPSPEKVDQEVARLPRFQENGRFSRARYRQLDNMKRMAIWRDERDRIAEDHYRSDIAGLRVSSAETAFAAGMAFPERKFELTAFPVSSYPDEEIAAYVADNPDRFMVIHLSRITIKSSEREARQVLDSIIQGTTTFEDAARTQSTDTYAESGGDMGIRLAYELSDVPDSEDRGAVITLAKGELSPIVKVPEGWAFFRSEETPYPADTSDGVLMQKIRSYYMEFERGRVDDWLIRKAEDFIALANERDFNTAVSETGLEKRSFGPLPVNYGGNDFYRTGTNLFTALASFEAPELAAADTNENFWQTAFLTPLNTPSRPVVAGDYVVVLYPLEETTGEDAADAGTNNIAVLYPSWISYFTERSVDLHFITSKKLENRFFEAYLRYILAPNNEG
ncbi:MAG: SurA N-terminal domain-containing protein [Spirochaetaceae bacterium]|jgi:hypothetical protein|nr:SurA N-terminal domain-containing protein [Spirochaetaceae bacterium]